MEMEAISRIRTAAAWMRRTSEPLDRYPRRKKLSEREQFYARQFATGNFPWPTRWTKRLFEAASAN